MQFLHDANPVAERPSSPVRRAAAVAFAVALLGSHLLSCRSADKIVAPPSTSTPTGGTSSPGGRTAGTTTGTSGAIPQGAVSANRLARLYFQPIDVTSDVSRTPVQLIFDNFQNIVPADVVQKLAELASLVTYPEQEAVATTAQVTEGTEQDPRGYLTLVPVSPLSERWYALRVAKLPEGIETPVKTFLVQPDGTLVSRFRLGSQPVLRSISYCQRSTDVVSIFFNFSETVVAASGSRSDFMKVQQATTGARCELSSEPSINRFDCSGLRMDQEAKAIIVTGLSSPAGIPVATFASGRLTAPLVAQPLEFRAVPNSLEAGSGGCRNLFPN